MIRATEHDIDRVYGIIEECSEWLRKRGVRQWNPVYPRDLFSRDVKRGAVYYFMDGDSLVGTATICDKRPSYYPTNVWADESRVWFLCRFAVARRLKGNKFGARILDQLETKAARHGIEWIRMDVTKSNPFLESYYSALGYQRAGEVILANTPSILMEKRIGEDPTPPAWTESDSQKFADLGDIFVPNRDLQNQAICELLSLPNNKSLVVELCSGQGLLAERILGMYPQANVYALDGSSEMITQSRSSLSHFEDRFEVHGFDLYAPNCLDSIRCSPNAVVSSLAIHHLDAKEKRSLFKKVFDVLVDGGIFLISDIVEPTMDAGREHAASQWDSAVRKSSRRLRGDDSGYHEFVNQRWNHYRTPDPRDKPSGLYEQLAWLDEAGFTCVDVSWMRAGHAIFGGKKIRS